MSGEILSFPDPEGAVLDDGAVSVFVNWACEAKFGVNVGVVVVLVLVDELGGGGVAAHR